MDEKAEKIIRHYSDELHKFLKFSEDTKKQLEELEELVPAQFVKSVQQCLNDYKDVFIILIEGVG